MFNFYRFHMKKARYHAFLIPELILLFNFDCSKPQKSLSKTFWILFSPLPCSVFPQIIPGNIGPQIALVSCNPRLCTIVHTDLKVLLVIYKYIKLFLLRITLSFAPCLHPTVTHLHPPPRFAQLYHFVR